MALSIWFWVLWVVSLAFGMWADYNPGQPWFRPGGRNLMIWALLGILGYAVFGGLVK